MTTTAYTTEASQTSPAEFPRNVSANGLEIYVDQVGEGPDVLLIGGLGDTVESWQFQLDGLADSYRLTAFDNRGPAGPPCRKARSRSRRWPTTRPAVLRALDISSAHVAGFSAAASSPRSWRSATRSSCAASCCRAPGR